MLSSQNTVHPPQQESGEASQIWPNDVDVCCDDLRRHRAAQERFWTFQRWAWAGFALAIAAALLGFTGAGGLFARTVDQSPMGSVDVPIITRVSTADDVLIKFSPGGAERRVHLSAAFLNAWQIETIQPAPARSLADKHGIAFHFRTAPNENAAVHLFVKARQTGVFRTAISIDAQDSITHRVVVLP